MPASFSAACVAILLLGAHVVAPGQAATAKSIYLSAAGNDANTGRTADQAWRTLGRLQSELNAGGVTSGDQVLLARGNVFTGSLRLGATTQGTAAAPIVFTSFGTGAAPIINGLAALSAWQAVGNNRWRTTCTTCVITPTFLLLNGEPQPLARWPNLDAPNQGYRSYASFSGRSSINDPTLPANSNWTGGDVVLRSVAWVLDRLPIVSQSGGTLTFASPASYDIQAGYGYFIQNHLDALDRDGEWVYDAAAKTITLQLSSDPAAQRIEIPAQRNVLELRGSTYITFRGLDVRGAAQDLINADDCSHIVFDQMNLRYNGNIALQTGACRNITLSASSARDSMNVGLQMQPCNSCRVSGFTLERVGLLAGLGGSGDLQYFGTILGGDNFVIENSVLRNLGYVGISLYGPGIVRNNVVSAFNRVKIDGGGIYTYRQSDVVIVNNIVRDASGSSAGTPWTGTGTNGIYIDDNAERVTVHGNTIANVSGASIYLHNTRDVTVTNNLIFNPGEVGLQMTDDELGSYALEHSFIRQNQFLVRAVPALAVGSSETSTLFSTLGTVDANVYCDPFGDVLVRVELPGSPERAMPLAQWRNEYGRDAISTQCAERYDARSVTGAAGPNRITNAAFDSDLSNWFGWPDDTLDARWETGRLDGGSLLLGYKGPSSVLHFDNPIGAVQAAQTYRLRVDAKRVAGTPALTAYLRQIDAPYAYRSQVVPLFVSDARRTFEAFFDVPANESNTILAFELNAPGAAVGLDNVQLQQVTATTRSLSDVVRFDVNPGALTQTLTLDNFVYRDLNGAALQAGSTLMLAPFSGRVLLRGVAATQAAGTPPAATLVVPGFPRAYLPIVRRP
jgi:parallel beta-helix repeat protein